MLRLDRERNMGKDKIYKWIIALLIINLILVVDMGTRVTSELKKTREDIRNMESEMDREISGLERTIVNQLAEQNNPINELSYDVTGLNEEDLTAEVELKVLLKEVGPESEIRWAIEDEGTDNAKYAILKSDGNLTFIGKLDLSIEKNYKTKLIEVQNNYGIKQLNLEPMNLDLKSRYFENRVSLNESSGSSGKYTFYEESIFEIRTIDEEHLGLEKVEMTIFVDDKTVSVVDITDEILMGNNVEDLKREVQQSVDYQSNDKSKHDKIGVSAETSSGTSTSETSIYDTRYLMHYFYGSYADLTDSDDLELKYRFTFKDGYVEEEL